MCSPPSTPGCRRWAVGVGEAQTKACIAKTEAEVPNGVLLRGNISLLSVNKSHTNVAGQTRLLQKPF